MKIINSSKDEMEIEFEILTLAEIIRVYLNKDENVSLAAWKRDHPTKNPVLIVKTKGKSAKKAVSDAVGTIVKELDKLEDDFKKLK